MKLSEMNMRELAKTLQNLIDPLSKIAGSKEINACFSEISRKEQNGMTNLEKTNLMLVAFDKLLGKYYAEIIRIFSIMTGRTDKEVEEYNGYKMLKEMKESIDKEFIDFFKSFAVTDSTGKDETE